MSDVYIRNKHGVVHSIPADMLDLALSQGSEKITKAEYEKAPKGDKPSAKKTTSKDD